MSTPATEPAPNGEPKADPTKAAKPTEPAAAQGDPADLGDAGKKALDAERAARKAAEKQAGDLQAQIDKINQANETAVEKAQREATEAREAAATATADALRFRVAAKFNISEDDADLFLTGADEATLTRQAERLAERTPTTAGAPRPDLSQGGRGTPSASPDEAAAAWLQGLTRR